MHITKYITGITLSVGFFVLFIFFLPHTAHAQCGAVPTGGSYTATTSCAFAGTVDGVDNGNITINGGVTLTINAGQTIVWGPGQSLIINGSIAINSTGKLRQTRLWMIDGDSDGYASSTAQVAQDTSPGSGYRNRADLTSFTAADCLDSGAGALNVYQNVANIATDSDQDGYYIGSVATICVGTSTTVSGRTYYKGTSGTFSHLVSTDAIGSDDCNDGLIATNVCGTCQACVSQACSNASAGTGCGGTNLCDGSGACVVTPITCPNPMTSSPNAAIRKDRMNESCTAYCTGGLTGILTCSPNPWSLNQPTYHSFDISNCTAGGYININNSLLKCRSDSSATCTCS